MPYKNPIIRRLKSRERNKRFFELNPGKRAEYRKKDYLKNGEKRKAYQKKYRAENKERCKENWIKYRAENREKINEYQRNSKKIKEMHKRYSSGPKGIAKRKRQIENLTDAYIKNQIYQYNKKLFKSFKDIPLQLVEIKRKMMHIKRVIRAQTASANN